VQGVGFRWFVTQAARRLGLGGSVRNLADGSVEIVAAGTPDAMVAFETEVRRGPAGSQVESVLREPTEVIVSPAFPFVSLQ
jgi:acylphosphatase